MHYIFSIEGNIGSGKSTLLNILSKKIQNINSYEIVYLTEPVSIWESIKDSDGKNIIEKFYGNNEKYAFSFQMMAYISRIHEIKKIIDKNKNLIIICERSVFTDKNVFTQMLYDDNKISEIEFNIYKKWFYEFLNDIPISGIIYLKTSTEICDHRVKQRNRKGETIPLEYLDNCNKYHNNWLSHESVPVLNLNGDINFKENIPNNWINIIKNFIIELSPNFNKTYIQSNLLIENGMPIY